MRQSFTHFDCACQGRTSERAARVAGGEPAGACRVSSREAPSSTLAAVKRRRVRRHPTRLSRRHKPVPPRSCRLRGKTAARDRAARSRQLRESVVPRRPRNTLSPRHSRAGRAARAVPARRASRLDASAPRQHASACESGLMTAFTAARDCVLKLMCKSLYSRLTKARPPVA